MTDETKKYERGTSVYVKNIGLGEFITRLNEYYSLVYFVELYSQGRRIVSNKNISGED